jgi:hypothetical protein
METEIALGLPPYKSLPSIPILRQINPIRNL